MTLGLEQGHTRPCMCTVSEPPVNAALDDQEDVVRLHLRQRCKIDLLLLDLLALALLLNLYMSELVQI